MIELKKLFKSFAYAFNGIIYTIKNERNMRIHITCLIYMFSILLFGGWFDISKVEYAILVLASGSVIGSEISNTAIENAVNLASCEKTDFGKISKDAAAGTVLIRTIFAIICGIIIMFQPEAFKKMFEYFISNPLMLLMLLLSFIPAIVFIFYGFNFKKR